MQQIRCKWSVLPSSIIYMVIIVSLAIINFIVNPDYLNIIIAYVAFVFVLVVVRELACYRFIKKHINDAGALSSKQEAIIYDVLQYSYMHSNTIVHFNPRKFKCIRALSTFGFEVEFINKNNKLELYQFYEDKESGKICTDLK